MITFVLTVGRALVDFLRHPLGQIVAICLVFGSLAYFHGEQRYRQGVADNEAGWVKAVGEQEAAARQIEAAQAATGARIQGEAQAARVEIRWQTRTLIEKVPYLVPTDPAVPGLPVGFVRLHTAATAGLPLGPDPAGRADGADSGVALAELAEVDVANAGACREVIDRLTRLQQWVREAVSAPIAGSAR